MAGSPGAQLSRVQTLAGLLILVCSLRLENTVFVAAGCVARVNAGGTRAVAAAAH